MKASLFEGWLMNENTRPLLFFVQSMEEMLFHYGHDSYKVPTLNFHYLCIEVLTSIKEMEKDIVDKGNMSPLFEELEVMFSIDTVAQEIYGPDFSSLFYGKNEHGEYTRSISNLRKNPSSEDSIKLIKKTISFLCEDMSVGDKYLSILKLMIESVLHLGNSFTGEQQSGLLSLSRLLLTELINRGYSQEYIYSCLIKRYYSNENEIKNIDDEISRIWEWFDFTEKKYKVILPIKRTDHKKLLEHFKNICVKENIHKCFGNSCKWVVEVEVSALEPEIAREKATALITLFAALKQYSSHISKAYYTKQAIVRECESEQEFQMKEPVKLMNRTRNQTEQQAINRVGELITTFPVMGDKMVNVINLHTSALETSNESNQLLNLWTIVEVLVDVNKRVGLSKIIQISNTLTTVLNSSYIRSLIEQLILDLELCDEEYSTKLNEITSGNNKVEKTMALLVLQEYEKQRGELISRLERYPLLSYRIEHYASIFSNREKLKIYLESHRKRVGWQITRIYRNRNMIVHDGSHFPYIDLILQNLHYYIDNLIDTIILYVEHGYESLEAIYAYLSNKEYQHLLLLEQKEVDKQSTPIEEDFIKEILGDYL